MIRFFNIRHILLAMLGIIFLFSMDGFSQGFAGGGMGGEGNRIEGRTKFMPLPYINYDRFIGFSVGALPILLYNPVEKDTLSSYSVAGMFTMYTTNDTWFVMGFTALFLDEDK